MIFIFQDFLRDQSRLTPEQLHNLHQAVLQGTASSLYFALVASDYLPQERVADLACQCYGMERLPDLFHLEVDWATTAKLYPHHQPGHCDVSAVLEHGQCFLTCEGGSSFLLHDPDDVTLRDKLATLLDRPVTLLLATPEEGSAMAEYHFKPQIYRQRLSLEQTARGGNQSLSAQKSGVEQVLDDLLTTALDWRATDLRIIPLGDWEAKVVFTVDGANRTYTTMDGRLLPKLRNIIKTRCNAPEKRDRLPIEAKMDLEYQGKSVDVRVNIVTAYQGFDFNFRFIRQNLMQLEDLGLNPQNLTIYKHILGLTKGLVIVSGPTGSGKTSLLYAGFRVALAQNTAIYAMEDPVEISLPGITQVEIDTEQGLTKQVQFNSALRHRPGIVAFGEIRDAEDAAPAINFAHTGHPAHATLHANDALGVISRLVNMGVDAYVLGDTLAAVVAQRLVRRVCPHCGESYTLALDHPWRILFSLGEKPLSLTRGRGCVHCGGTGYRGQMAINEIILTSPALRNAIQTQQPRSAMEAILTQEGFVPYLQDGIQKALDGLTTLEELEAIAKDLL